MAGETQHGMQCGEFEAALSEALDGALGGPRLEGFRAHQAECATCGLLLTEAREGIEWLRSLEEVEPPSALVPGILMATSGVVGARAAQEAPAESWLGRARGWALPVIRPALQPRFAMSFAMAFFSISIVLNLAGVSVSDVRYLDLRPSALRDSTVRGLVEASARVEKYYENLRFVYEIESRVRELKDAADTPQRAPEKTDKDKQNRNQKPNEKTSGHPDSDRQQRYSLEWATSTLALGGAPAPAAPGLAN